MPSAQVASVVIAAAQSIAKVFLIGSVGAASVHLPRKSPLLPPSSVPVLARWAFHTLLLSLIYSTTAKSVSIESLSDYWMVLVASFAVLGTSFGVASVLGQLFRVGNQRCLTVAATFPNIVALPILIFPSLCEHAVVYENFVHSDGLDERQQSEICRNQATTMIFVYFFGFSILFWSLGHPVLVAATPQQLTKEEEESVTRYMGVRMQKTLLQITTSPGCLALMAGVTTGLIPGLSDELFQPTGVLRFLGDAVETMGRASSPISTMVVAANLMSSSFPGGETATRPGEQCSMITDMAPVSITNNLSSSVEVEDCSGRTLTDPSDLTSTAKGASYGGDKMPIDNIQENDESSNYEFYRVLLWFTLSRLVVSPAIIIAFLWWWRNSLPPLVALVVAINSSLPGALIVVVILLSNAATAPAALVTKIYGPTYLLSIFSIATWAAVALYCFLPDE